MSNSQETSQRFDPTPLIIAALDREIMKDDPTITLEQLAMDRELSEYYERLLIAGYTEEQIDVMWENKTPQEILAMPHVHSHSP